jgi:hypothetical protein
MHIPTGEVDNFIDALWKWRSKMKPEQPNDIILGEKVTAIADPRWYSEGELKRGGSLLHLRHPGFGWLHFWLPKDDAARLAGFLQAQVREQDKNQPSLM